MLGATTASGTTGTMFDVHADAKALHDATKGSMLTTDNKTLYSVIANRTSTQLQELRDLYRREFGHELIDDVKSDFNVRGDYERLLIGLLMPRSEFEAKAINKAVKGMTTDTQMLVDILPQRNVEEMEEIKSAYLRLFNKTLEDDLQTSLKGSEERFYTALVNHKAVYFQPGPTDDRSIDEAARQLYNAGQGRLGTDEATFINVLTRGGTDFLQRLNYRYAMLHGDSLVTAADKEMGGFFAKALKALLTPHDEFYADVLFKAMSGMTTDDSRLIHTVVSRRHCLAGINWVFVHKFGQSIRARVEKECSGNYKKAMVDLLENV